VSRSAAWQLVLLLPALALAPPPADALAPHPADGSAPPPTAGIELGTASPTGQDTTERFRPADVFELEWASDPRISPDGGRVAYVRNGFDVEEDRRRSSIWIVDADGGNHRAVTSGRRDATSPRWSPDGERLLYLATDGEEGTEVWVRWLDTGQEARLTRLTESPSGIAWSPDGRRIALSLFVPEDEPAFAEMPSPPEGADWGAPFRYVDELQYRSDGAGYLESGHRHLFVLPAEGGTPRQLTRGPHDHGGTPRWTPDGERLVFSANRRADADREPLDTEVYVVSMEGEIEALTDRRGPDGSPAVSPVDGRIAYVGFDDRYQGYQVSRLHVAGPDGSDPRVLTEGFDRSVQSPVWSADGAGIFFQYDDEGTTKIAYVAVGGERAGEVRTLVDGVGGLSLGRPYAGGQFSVSRTGRFAYTRTRPDHPADVAVGGLGGSEGGRLTRLNDDLLGHRDLASVEEFRFESSHDGREIQGWVMKPPGFDSSGSYPLLLEIHGGPFANYGERFSAELQLYAAAGYVVLYVNPRGSTGYGEEFGNLIHHAYPGRDYDDLISGVDELLRAGYVDPDRLYVTGGSGGGVLTAWIVGRTDRFRAAVSQKPVINWYSFVLTADLPGFFYRYWFPGPPWEHRDHYMERSPISLAGEVETPTMLITGERDFRTPISETEQFYAALKIREVETAMVRVPDASHGIASKPSNLVGKVAHVLEWFERHGGEPY